MEWPGVSVVVPVYQSTYTLSVLMDRVDAALASLGDYEVILVDDGSQDVTWHTVEHLSTRWSQVVGLRLGRNYGQHNALVAGVRQASFPVVVTIDDDLQNPPEEIPRLVNKLLSENLDVVYGIPRKVEQSVLRKLASRITWRALSSGLGIDSALEITSFRAFRTRNRDAFATELGTSVSLDALLAWGSERFGSTRVRHDPRSAGSSSYTWRRLVRTAIDTTTGYSILPLQIASILGLATAGFGLLVLMYVVIRPLATGESVQGFPFLASTIAIFSGAQLLTLGIFGEYLARMHFRIMRKPTYVISETTRNQPDHS